MAIKLQHSMFVHIPKTGGRWVAGQLKGVHGYTCVGDPVYDAHESPDTDLPVFAFIRHPITMLNSLWYHRSRKHSNKRAKDWNWQQDHELERECGCSNYFKFFENVAEHPEIVTRYYMEFVGKYERYTLWKAENLAEELVRCLDLYGERFNRKSILEQSGKKVGYAGNDLTISSRPELVYTIISNERKFCDHFGYNSADILMGGGKNV